MGDRKITQGLNYLNKMLRNVGDQSRIEEDDRRILMRTLWMKYGKAHE